ncbi:bifunctional (p)ppGpp synthetase/guanosine-3',5'-bis(diphosphate) 3'-pyrophosphohydrolase [Candidatus Uhrbacteria bacterium]|nr:bifunctional (p)ppGpp synthetase/guanosine-3',5'-bis(diphosphate) 3'-pyrophosphohydrolase [Candidatus Uhrbacteria bacterium]
MAAGIEKILKTVKMYHPKADLAMIRLTYEFAESAHKGQKRTSGEPYITHPLAAAQILADMKMPSVIIIACLLHDVPEDTAVTLKEIEKNFGAEVATLVSGITKLGKLKYRGAERYIENLRKMFMAMANDVRVIFIKFADRLHNLETLSALPPEKRMRIALESLEIYAPIANRLGMFEIKGRLEDAAFKYVYPEEYKWTVSAVSEKLIERERYIKKVAKKLETELHQAGIKFVQIYGRAKRLYSLYQKLLRHERDVSKIYDLIALRIIVKDVADCYAVLGIVHGLWKPMRGRIKDYIAQPKPNGYQSLHTTVFAEDGKIIEVQIRTEKMQEEAEYGIAAHWGYDETRAGRGDEPKLKWVKELAQLQKDLQDKQQFLESLDSLKIDVFQNRIFVFTPKGDVIDLPERATPIDFAYAIHSDIGDKCVGARINDQLTALNTPLRSGDVVEIQIDKNRKAPSPDWLAFVKTAGARAKIRATLKRTKTNWMQKIEKISEQNKK